MYEQLKQSLQNQKETIEKAITDFENKLKTNETLLIEELQQRMQAGVYPDSEFLHEAMRVLNRVISYQTFNLPDPKTEFEYKQNHIVFEIVEIGNQFYFITVHND